MMNSFPMSGGFDRPQGSHENMLNAQATLALDVSKRNSILSHELSCRCRLSNRCSIEQC